MIHEIRKLWTNGWILFLTLTIIVSNSILYYNYCIRDEDGYGLQHIQELYHLPTEEVKTTLKELKERSFATEEYLDPTLVTGNIYHEISLYNEVLKRKQEIEGYSQNLRDLRDQVTMKALLFPSDDPFTQDVLAQTKAGYDRLEAVVPTGDISGGAEPFTRWRVADLFVVLLGVFASMVLVTQEKNAGLLSLLRPTKRGHSHLYFCKYFAMSLFMILGYVVIYGTELMITSWLFGFGDLSRPAQSVYPYIGCPFVITIGEMLGIYLSSHLLMCWTLSSLFFFLCIALRKPIGILLTAGALAVLLLYLKTASSLWLRALCPMPALDQIMETGYLFLNMSGRAIPLHWVNLSVLGVLNVLCCILGGILFCKQSLVPGTKKLRFPFPALRSCKLMVQEGWKVLFLHSALILLILFGAVQAIRYRDFYIPQTTWEFYYRSYSQRLSGEPNKEKDQFLIAEEERFSQIEAAMPEARDGEEYAELERKLLPKEAFLAASAQYRNLESNQSYVYAGGYDRLYLEEGLRDDLVNTILLTFVLILAFSGLIAVEHESGVYVLIKTAGKEEESKKYKRFFAFTLTLVTVVIAYLPQYICVKMGYGLPLGYAQANSLSVFAALPNGITLNGVLLLTQLIRIGISAVSCSVVMILSSKTKNTVFTILCSCAFLLIPLILVLIL